MRDENNHLSGHIDGFKPLPVTKVKDQMWNREDDPTEGHALRQSSLHAHRSEERDHTHRAEQRADVCNEMLVVRTQLGPRTAEGKVPEEVPREEESIETDSKLR